MPSPYNCGWKIGGVPGATRRKTSTTKSNYRSFPTNSNVVFAVVSGLFVRGVRPGSFWMMGNPQRCWDWSMAWGIILADTRKWHAGSPVAESMFMRLTCSAMETAPVAGC